MSTIWIRKFARGLDSRRLPETTSSDALIHATDGHITRGGEFEKRAAFVLTYTLPNPTGRTVSLAATAESIVVFGSGTTPGGMPSGVQYQQLENSPLTLERVSAWDLFEDKIYAVGAFPGPAHYYDGVRVSREGQAAFRIISIVSGTPGDTINIFVDGVSVTGGPVAWAASPNSTAIALRNAINATVTVPDYVSDTFLSGVFVRSATVGVNANGRIITVVTTGTAVVAPTSSTLIGGVDPLLNTTRYARTIDTKVYTLSGSNLQFSSIGNPRDWTGELGGVGYGFIDTSSYTSGSEDLTAVVEFRDAAAVFAQRTVQIWQLRADPANNALRRRLRNTGTSCPNSITQFGDDDIFYLDENGLRSLRARDSSSAASTYSVGVRVDPLIVAKLRSLTEAERLRVIGLIEPLTGNFWLIMKNTIFVFAYFPEEGVSGWTTYSTHRFNGSGVRVDFNVDDAVVFNRRVYLRSGRTIMVYGGLSTGQTTDATEAEIWLPYLDGEDPGTPKEWRALDAAVSGHWALSVGMNLADTSVADSVASLVVETSYNSERIGLAGKSTHISPRFKTVGTGAAVLGACAVHYESEAA